MAVRGIRGATTTEEDSEAAIVDATIELLAEIARENTFDPGDLANFSNLKEKLVRNFHQVPLCSRSATRCRMKMGVPVNG